MKILILSVTAGEGHNSTARAMRSCFIESGAQCDILDTYGYVSPAIAHSINKGYLFVSSRAKEAYRIGYRLAEKRHAGGDAEFSAIQLTNLPVAHEIGAYIRRNAPDAVLFTHPFAGLILDILKKQGRLTVPTVGVLTDFIFHPFWEDCTSCSYVVMPSSALRFQAYRKGFADEQLLSFGIPISPKFAHSIPKEEARASLGLDPAAKTVLLMGGSMGYGHMTDTVRALDAIPEPEPLQLIAVCGNNARAKRQMDALHARHRLLVFGFTDQVDVLMDASDCIVTKPGGLTTSEALAKRLPMVIVDPIPGQETRNTEFLLNSGAAAAANKVCGADELVWRILNEPGRLDAMRACITPLSHPESSRDVCRFVLGLGAQ